MQFTNFAALALASAAAAAPVSDMTKRDGSSAFSLISARSASPVHLQPIVARGLELWVGGNTSTYCPAVSGVDCSNFKNGTAFGAQPGNPTSVGMSVNVPGGQLLYIAPGGAIQYTQAHSASMPSGSVIDGFNYVAPSDGQLGSLTPVANSSTGFLACPSTAAEKTTGPWQLFADVSGVQVPSGCTDDCYGIGALASNTDGPAAWQYA